MRVGPIGTIGARAVVPIDDLMGYSAYRGWKTGLEQVPHWGGILRSFTGHAEIAHNLQTYRRIDWMFHAPVNGNTLE